MGFRIVLLGTVGLLAMLSTSAVGQFPEPNNAQPFSTNFQSNRPRSNNPFGPLLDFLASIEQDALHNQPPNTPQNFPPAGQTGGFNSYSSHSNTPQHNPSNFPPAGFNPYSSQLNSPQRYPSVPQRGGLSPANPSINSPNLYHPPNIPSNPSPPVNFNPYNSPPNYQQPHPYFPQTSFNSFNPPSNSHQQYSSGNQHTGLNFGPPTSGQQQYSLRNQPGGFNSNSNQHYQTSSNQQPGTFNTDSKPLDSHQTPSSSSHQSEVSSTDSKPPDSPQTPSSSSHESDVSSADTTNQKIASSNSPESESTKSTSDDHVSSNSHSSTQGHASSASKHHPHPHPTPSDEDPLKEHRIVCIFNNQHFYRDGFTPSHIEPHLCTHINYEFAVLDPKTYEVTTGEPDLDIEMNFYEQVIALKKVNDKLKIILSVGGWADSMKKYSEMAADEGKRKSFVESCVSYIKKHEFDGMDLAWEYPNCWQGAIGANPKDKDNFILLLKDLKAELKKEDLIFSVSVGAIKREMEAAYNIPEINNLVDYMNVMTYDMHGPWESATAHHMQFETMPGDNDPYCNVKAAMNLWHDKGADKFKLNLGIAFYGRSFSLADPNVHGMGAPAKGVGDPGPDSNEGGLLLYSEMCQFLNAGNWTEDEDKQAGFYAYCGDQWACYDNPIMVVKKTKYVVNAGYGGVLLKYLSGDDFKGLCFSMDFPLLKMVRLEMTQSVKKANRRRRHRG